MDNARPALTWHDHAPLTDPDGAVAEGGELPTSIVAVERALENLSRQIREAQPWDARPAALRRFRWLLKAVRIQRNVCSLAAALQDRAGDLPDDAARPLLIEADRLWELTDPLASLINELVTGADGRAPRRSLYRNLARPCQGRGRSVRLCRHPVAQKIGRTGILAGLPPNVP